MSEASLAVTTARTWIVCGVVSVTARLPVRPSHSGTSFRISWSWSRISSSGALWSRCQ